MSSFPSALTIVVYLLAAIAEIAGCFAFWVWLRQGHSPIWAAGGIICLILFAYFLTLIPSNFAGRAYAAYGGIYIIASLGWMWIAEGNRPDRWDILGGTIALVGAAIILLGPRNLTT